MDNMSCCSRLKQIAVCDRQLVMLMSKGQRAFAGQLRQFANWIRPVNEVIDPRDLWASKLRACASNVESSEAVESTEASVETNIAAARVRASFFGEFVLSHT